MEPNLAEMRRTLHEAGTSTDELRRAQTSGATALADARPGSSGLVRNQYEAQLSTQALETPASPVSLARVGSTYAGQ